MTYLGGFDMSPASVAEERDVYESVVDGEFMRVLDNCEEALRLWPFIRQ